MIELAEQVAKTILEYSNKEHQIEGVLLFGSTLTGQRYRPERKTPQDVDMVIIHRAGELSEFDWDEYMQGVDLCDHPVGEEKNNRNSAANILTQLGSLKYTTRDAFYEFEREQFIFDTSKEVLAEQGLTLEKKFERIVWQYSQQRERIPTVMTIVAYKEVKGVDLAPGDEELIKLVTSISDRIKQKEAEIEAGFVYTKMEKKFPSGLKDFNEILDLHTLDARLLSRELQERDLPTKFNPDEERAELCRKKCTDPTFWHSVLSTGRLFDGEHFTIPVEEKYKGCLELFPH